MRLVQVSLALSRKRAGVLMVMVSLTETTSGTGWHIISVTILLLSVPYIHTLSNY